MDGIWSQNKRLGQRLHTGARRLEPAAEQVVRLVKEISSDFVF